LKNSVSAQFRLRSTDVRRDGASFPLVLLGLLLDVASPGLDMAIRRARHQIRRANFFRNDFLMPRKSDEERLNDLLARRNRTDLAIRRLKSKNAKTARAQDARRRIVAGALALEHTIKNPGSDFARIMLRLLDEYARPHERFLFDDLLSGPSPTGDAQNLTSDELRENRAESISNAAE